MSRIGVGVTGFALGWAAFELNSKNKSKAASASNGATGPPAIDIKSGYPFSPLSLPPPPSPEQVTARLNQDAWSVANNNPRLAGFSRYDGSQLPSNSPCEDRYIHGRFPAPSSAQSGREWLTWGVFDGHLGAKTAEALTKHLIPYVHKSLSGLAEPPDDATVHQAIASAFLALDDAFIQHAESTVDRTDLSWAEKSVGISPGSNGSCALLSLYDPSSRKLHVACTGDSRAVMGRRDPTTGKWETIPLSIDQSGSNEAEAERIRSEHRGEDISKIVKDGRVLGLATARAFGDGHWKWPLQLLERLRVEYLADYMQRPDPEVHKNPPYITAKPEVTTTVLKVDQPAFMIMASDGLWDVVTSEQAVSLVARWLEWRAKGSPAPEKVPQDKFGPFDWSQVRRRNSKMMEEKTTVQDGNAAVHLTRNALGGAHHDMISGVLSFESSYSRYARDDITVQVVFFNC